MPIDFKKKIADDESALDALLEKRRLGAGGIIDERRKAIQGSRLPLDFGGVASNFNITPTASPDVTRKLDLNLDDTLSEQKMGLDKERVNFAYNRALQRAQDANLDRRSAEDFARQIMQDEIRRQQEGAMNEKRRQQSIRQQEIANAAHARGESLQDYPNPQAEYEQAMTRILVGMPFQLLNYYIAKGPNSQPQLPGGQLTTGTTFSTKIDPMTGRRQ